jgi:hypothetical protein
MGIRKFIVWSAFFAIVANVSAGFGQAALASSTPLELRDVCLAQAAITDFLSAGPSQSDGEIGVCAIQSLMDLAARSDAPEPLPSGAPLLVTIPASPTVAHSIVWESTWAPLAVLPETSSDPGVTAFADGGDLRPSPRYHLPLSPHAPPRSA